MGSSSNAPQLPHQGEGQQEEQKQEQKQEAQKQEKKQQQHHQDQDKRQPFDLECESYTPQLYVDDLGRFRAAGDADATSYPCTLRPARVERILCDLCWTRGTSKTC